MDAGLTHWFSKGIVIYKSQLPDMASENPIIKLYILSLDLAAHEIVVTSESTASTDLTEQKLHD